MNIFKINEYMKQAKDGIAEVRDLLTAIRSARVMGWKRDNIEIIIAKAQRVERALNDLPDELK